MIQELCEGAAKGIGAWISDFIGTLFVTQNDFKRNTAKAKTAAEESAGLTDTANIPEHKERLT
ncbi:MAG: hypothetical protein QNJ44_03145 [Rhodobacter sp.]|nr:hypothetical protein [Rhodobacter sp.]